jgi:hypothetical protein
MGAPCSPLSRQHSDEERQEEGVVGLDATDRRAQAAAVGRLTRSVPERGE